MDLRTKVLGAEDLKLVKVHVLEWDCNLYIRTIDGAERERFFSQLERAKGPDEEANYKNYTASLVALCVGDESGKRVFDDKDIEALAKKSAQVLTRVALMCQKHNGLTKEDVEEAVKNSARALSGDSG